MTLKSIPFLMGVMTAALTANSLPPLQTVNRVDLNRYIGKWYEIARYPNRFEKDCVSDVAAQYSLRDDGKITVVNSCRKQSGEVKESKGTAKVVEKNTNAKLKVTFFWPFYGDYWVIGLDSEYRYAVISEPDRKYLWILSRTPHLTPELYEQALEIVRKQGLDPSRLVKPLQSAK
jgi:apolipoprotein D and lipocalin family protein